MRLAIQQQLGRQKPARRFSDLTALLVAGARLLQSDTAFTLSFPPRESMRISLRVAVE